MDMGLFYDSTLCIIGIVVTVATFETAKRNLQHFTGYNGRGNGGEHE